MATFQKYHAIKLSFINKNLLKTCFDHNFSRSQRIRSRFCTIDVLPHLYRSEHQILKKTNEKLNFRASKKIRPRASLKLQHRTLPKEFSEKEVEQRSTFFFHCTPKSRHQRRSFREKNQWIYNSRPAKVQKLDRIRADGEKL